MSLRSGREYTGVCKARQAQELRAYAADVRAIIELNLWIAAMDERDEAETEDYDEDPPPPPLSWPEGHHLNPICLD